LGNQVKSLSAKEKQEIQTTPSGERSSGVRFITVGADSDGQRLDNFLQRELRGVPKSRIYRMVRKGEVRINKGRAKAQTRLHQGDSVRVPPITERAPAPARVAGRQAAALESAVLHEDRDLVVINKPSGMAVHGGSGLSFGVVEAMRTLRPEWAELSLVHRLDRETSGCLVLARRRSALRRLHEAFREDRVEKIYLALVPGHWPHGTITVDAPLSVHERRGGERHVTVAADGKASVTELSPTEFYSDCTLLRVKPLTGRTHQIRVHLQHVGSAIIGDERYGDPDINARFRRAGLKRLFLHAQSIAFADGSGNEQLFTAPLTEDLAGFLARLDRRQ
jgi:23S rRNA pseudouridine955/2504/2580 synthase